MNRAEEKLWRHSTRCTCKTVIGAMESFRTDPGCPRHGYVKVPGFTDRLKSLILRFIPMIVTSAIICAIMALIVWAIIHAMTTGIEEYYKFLGM